MAGMAAGLTNRELAAWANWTENTVETYLKQLYAKLVVQSRGQVKQLIIGELLDCLAMREAAE